MRGRFILLLMVSVTTINLFGQWNLEKTFNVIADDNIFNNFDRTTDKIMELSLQPSYTLETEESATKFSYLGSFNYYHLSSERTFHFHTLGLEYKKLLDEDGNTLLNAEFTYSQRVNRNPYTFYDFRNVTFSGRLIHSFTETSSLKAGYTFRSYVFNELPDFNYVEHVLFSQFTTSFETKTTIIAEANLGSKLYETANPTETSTFSSSLTGGRSRSFLEAPSATQLIGLLRLGQGIFDWTGVSLTLQYAVNLKKESRYLSSDYGFISDDEIFDDHYGFEGPTTSLTLTQMLSEETKFKAIYGAQERRYSSLPAYDLEGYQLAPQRKDHRTFLTLQLDHTIGESGLTLKFLYQYFDNAANDPYYQYTNNVTSINLSMPIF